MEICIYSNYDLWSDYDELVQEKMRSEDCTEEDLQQLIQEMDRLHWEEVSGDLQEYFSDGSRWIMGGTIRRWDGRYACVTMVEDFMDAYHKATRDCDCVEVIDMDGQLFIRSFHHDGVNYFELRRLTDKGVTHYEDYIASEPNGDEMGSVLLQILQKHTVQPYFAKNVYPHLCERVG